MIWKREEYIAHMNFEFTGSEMFAELFGLLVGLDKEWLAQSATQDELDLIAFDWDYVLKTRSGGNCQAITGIEPQITQETAADIFSID